MVRRVCRTSIPPASVEVITSCDVMTLGRKCVAFTLSITTLLSPPVELGALSSSFGVSERKAGFSLGVRRLSIGGMSVILAPVDNTTFSSFVASVVTVVTSPLVHGTAVHTHGRKGCENTCVSAQVALGTPGQYYPHCWKPFCN